MRRLPIYRALYMPILIAGMERQGALTVGPTALGVALFGATPPSLAVAAALLAGGVWALRRAAKADPMMLVIYRRSLRYRGFYPARSTPWARSRAPWL